MWLSLGKGKPNIETSKLTKLLLILIIPAILIIVSWLCYDPFGVISSRSLILLVYSAIAIGIISGSLTSEKSRMSIYLLIPAVVIVLLYLLYYLIDLDNVWAFALSLVTLGIGFSVNIIDKKQNRSAFIIMAYIIGFWIAFNLLELVFDIYIWEQAGLAIDNEADVSWAMRMALFSFFIVPVVYFTNKDVRAGLKEDKNQLMALDPKQKKILVYGLIIIVAIIVADILLIVFVEDTLTMMIALFCVTFITLMPLTFILSKSKDVGEGLDKITIAITMLIGTVVAPLIIILVIIPMWEGNLGGFGGVIFNGGLNISSILSDLFESYQGSYIGQGGGVNYFSYVFFVLLQSPAPALMIGFMVFGAVTVMVAQNIGGVGSILGGFSTSVIVIIPMLFIFEIFSGGIAPPELLVDILGLGTASFVFGLAETSAFILMLSIIAVFISAGKLLGRLVA